VQSHGNWVCLEDEMNPRNLNKVSTEFHLESDSVQYDKKQLQHTSYIPIGDNPMSYDRYNYQNQRYPSQVSDHLF
jgi:RNA polymerase II C-terminal domain phosphatase-like 1/2